jgi:hypothetical protein
MTLYAWTDPREIVRIPARGLAGQHKRFWREGGAARRVGDWLLAILTDKMLSDCHCRA